MADRGAQRRLRLAGFLATLMTGAALLASAVAGIASVDERLRIATAAAVEERATFTTVGTRDGAGAHRATDCDRSLPEPRALS